MDSRSLFLFKKSTFALAILVHALVVSLFLVSSRAPSIHHVKIRERTVKIFPAMTSKEVVSKNSPLISGPKTLSDKKEISEGKKDQVIPKMATPKKPMKDKPIKPSKPVVTSLKMKSKAKQQVASLTKKEPPPLVQKNKNYEKLGQLAKKINSNLKELKSSSHSQAIKPFESLHIQAEITTPIEDQEKENSLERLLSELKRNLVLPEYGAVKVELMIDGNGELVEVKILRSQSKKNSEYLKKTLPSCSFSCLNESIKGKTIQKLNVLFTNEM